MSFNIREREMKADHSICRATDRICAEIRYSSKSRCILCTCPVGLASHDGIADVPNTEVLCIRMSGELH